MNVLSFYPIHPVLINNLAEFFPTWNFDLVYANKEIPLQPWEEVVAEFYYEPNITLLNNNWNEVEQDKYDLIILHRRAIDLENRITVKRPSVFVVLSREHQPPENWPGTIVYANRESQKEGKYLGELIFISNSYKRLGRWSGEEEKFYFASKPSLIWKSKPGLFEKVSKEIKFYLPEKTLPWSEYQNMRIKARGYIELGLRNNSCAFIDALKMGQPTIVPSLGDYPMFIDNKKNGFLYLTEQEIIEAAKKLLDFDYAIDIGQHAYERALELIDEKEICKKWKKVFEEEMRR